MKAETKEQRGENNFLYALIMLTALAGGGVYYLNMKVETKKQQVTQMKLDYKEMMGLARKIKDMREKQPNVTRDTKVPSDIPTYLLEVAQRSGLPDKVVNVSKPASPKSVEQWEESAYTVFLKSEKTVVATRNQVLDFLDKVESDRPYLKSRDASFSYEKDSVQGYVVISYFKRISPRE